MGSSRSICNWPTPGCFSQIYDQYDLLGCSYQSKVFHTICLSTQYKCRASQNAKTQEAPDFFFVPFLHPLHPLPSTRTRHRAMSGPNDPYPSFACMYHPFFYWKQSFNQSTQWLWLAQQFMNIVCNATLPSKNLQLIIRSNDLGPRD